MKRIHCGRSYALQVLAIFNEAIETSTAIWDYAPRTPDVMESWFKGKEAGSFPVIGLVDDEDRLLAFGSYDTFRARRGYKYTVEHSVYVERSNRGKGFGKTILMALIEEATEQGYHTMIGGIDAQNRPSIALHEKCGFQCCGTIRHAGFKFGTWLDLAFYQLLLEGPENPVDG